MSPKTDKKLLGLLRKFKVTRVDGEDQPGGEHEHCALFVLDLHHDPHARKALDAYIESANEDYPLLAADLLNLQNSLPPLPPGSPD